MKTMAMAMMLLLAQSQVAPPAPARAGADEYIVGPTDVLELQVYGFDDMSRSALPVDADGTVDVPYLGRIAASGKTTRQLQEDLERRYVQAKMLTNPNISVTVREFRSQSVWVLGAVNSPMGVRLKGNLLLMAAIAAAGGFAREAGTKIQIFSAPPGQSKAGPVTTAGRKPDLEVTREDYDAGRANIRLKDGDTVVVPRAEEFSVSGEVKAVGTYVLRAPRTVWQAIQIDAGGPSPRWSRGGVYILRSVDGRQVKVKVKDIMKDLVQPGDTIVVPTRKW
jgi:polysaccharide export outer membrane protein